MIELVPGARLPERTFGPVTLTDIVRYQGASGDMNPIHHDDEVARSAGFPAAIGVGMLGAGWLTAYCTEHLGEETVRRFRTRFSAVVYRGVPDLARHLPPAERPCVRDPLQLPGRGSPITSSRNRGSAKSRKNTI